MKKKLLSEASAGVMSKNGDRWRAILAKPGQGSSGFYSADVLREYGPAALAPGAKAFIDHDTARSPKDMVGVYPDGAVWDEDAQALVGELQVFEHWKSFIEAVGPHAGLSIYMMGETDGDGNVTALVPDRMNGVDLVSYPGLVGSGLVEKLYESAKAALDAEGSATDVQDTGTTEGTQMEKEELLAILEGFKADVIAAVTPLQETAPAEEEATPEVADMAAVAEAAIQAGIPAELRAEIYESAKTMTPEEAVALVEARKNTVDAIRKAVTENATQGTPAGRVVESGATAAFSLTEIAKVN